MSWIPCPDSGDGRSGLRLAEHDVTIGAIDDRLQFCLLGGGDLELVQRLLEVIHESFPLFGSDVEVAMRIGHGPSRVFLRAAGRPADHFGNEILEAGRRYLVMGFVHGGVRVQTGVCHDAVDEVIDHHSDAVNSAEALIEAGLLWLCRHVSFPVCVWLCCFPKLVAAELVIRLNLFNLSPLTSADTC